MDKASILKYFIMGVLIYYLVRGICYIALWQGLVTLEEKAKKNIAEKKMAKQKRRLGKASETV